MADATVDLGATNHFGLPSGFNTQSSSTSVKSNNVQALDEVGDVACQRNVGEQTDYSQSASYCGSDFVGALAAFLTEFGNFQTVGVVTGLTITMSAGNYVTVDVSGHNHTKNAHEAGITLGYADFSDFFPHEVGEPFAAWDGFGVPDFGVTLGVNASPASATVTLSMTHVDTNDENGDHLVGKNITPRAELSMSFEGLPTSQTAAALETDFGAMTSAMLVPLVDSVDDGDANGGFDTMAFAAHANADLVTA